ncbi:hypothetical protein [Adhaeribacter pallidiroseus]|uniref:Uncharacterized protein n=1 Tax=Adhaeribacter pallidiroseus TaxID=2072847 RepID=A0A369QHZ3_9BACT|nr:hypothetical protein [Adhaeribacter pallidiroseus]RDC61918.1 hypothetical protein AHMF7616_00507 [Adhaeribacter pallidiroseus]
MSKEEIKHQIIQTLNFFSEDALYDLFSYLNTFISKSGANTLRISIFNIEKLVMPLPELIDRMAISELKIERISDNECFQEYNSYTYIYEFYKELGFVVTEEKYKELKDIHSRIWDLESDLRRGKEGILTKDEIADRTLLIRDLNRKRVHLKNVIAANYSFPLEIKRNHASE